jgi:hypothetical protein
MSLPIHALGRVATVVIPETVTGLQGVAGDKAAVFLQYLFLLTSLTKENRNGYWINIHNSELLTCIGRSYKGVIEKLKNGGIIEVNSRYSTGHNGKQPFAMSYRLRPEHRHGRSKWYTIRSAWAVDRALGVYACDPENLGEGGMHYRSLFDRFHIDANSALRDPALQNPWHQSAIARFANGNEFAKRCPQGRYHCLTTQMPRASRRYMRTLAEQELAIVDVSACQPLLLSYMVSTNQRQVTTTATTKSAHRPTAIPYDARFYDPFGCRSPHPTCAIMPCRSNVARDVQHWIELAESRELYDYLFDRVCELPKAKVSLQLPSGRHREIDLQSASEKSFKRACLVTLYQCNESMVASPLFRVIQNCFPTIASFLIEFKSHGHEALARMLQKLESELMIDRLGCSLMATYPNEPVQPIHDALLTTKRFANRVVELIKAQFALLGLNPHVKYEAL